MKASFKSLSFCFLLFGLASLAHAAPPILNYSGQVAVDGSPFTGTAYLKFAFVNGSGQFSYWSQDGTSANGSEPDGNVSVSVTGGLYSIMIGDTDISGMGEIDEDVFQNHNDVHLRVWFSDGVNGFEMITPDRRFASVPYVLGISDGSISSSKLDPNLTRYFSPSIEVAPVATSVIQGANTTLSVGADGRFLTYQWKRNGEALVGETNPTLSLAEINASTDDANYSVVISNDWGSVTSENVRLTVATALPSITLNGSASMTHEAAIPYVDAGATAVDALGNDLTSSIVVSGADVNVTELGEHTISYSVTDVGGNTNSASRSVTVEDTTAPILSLIGDSNHTHGINTEWADPGYSASDILEGNLTANVAISGDIDVNTTGEYTLTYSVADSSGNEANLTRTVNVQPLGPWTFTNAGATGRFGPTQAQIDANYSGTSLEGLVTINSTFQGIQEWVVPVDGKYKIEVLGAKGGGQFGGLGARMIGEFNLSETDTLKILVGQEGLTDSDSFGLSGGGGSFVVKSTDPLIIAGGGGGSNDNENDQTKSGGSTLINARDGFSTNDLGGNDSNLVAGGASGSGGGNSDYGYGSTSGFGNSGGGFLTNGIGYLDAGGRSFQNGGLGGNAIGGKAGLPKIEGGFGGGGSAVFNSDSSHIWTGGGGGGGYSGGGGNFGDTQQDKYHGGGGGSYNSGTNQDNQAGVNEGNGKVVITWIGN
jgi:hypothetical protein